MMVRHRILKNIMSFVTKYNKSQEEKDKIYREQYIEKIMHCRSKLSREKLIESLQQKHGSVKRDADIIADMIRELQDHKDWGCSQRLKQTTKRNWVFCTKTMREASENKKKYNIIYFVVVVPKYHHHLCYQKKTWSPEFSVTSINRFRWDDIRKSYVYR